MALWAKSQLLQGEALQTMQREYGVHFPLEIRHYCAEWLEQQLWSSIDTENPESLTYASQLLENLLAEIEQKSNCVQDFLYKLRLTEIGMSLKSQYLGNPLNLINVIRKCLETEARLVQMASEGMDQTSEPEDYLQIRAGLEDLKRKTVETESDLNNLQQKQELFVFQYQESLKIEAQLVQLQQQPPMDKNAGKVREVSLKQKKAEVDALLQQQATKLLDMRLNLAEKHKTTCQALNLIQGKVLDDELIKWKKGQQLSGNGVPFNDNINIIQEWCEDLAEIIWQNRQQIKKVEMLRQQLPISVPGNDILPELNSAITQLLTSLVTSTFIVEKQPPQVLKTQTRFSTSVRLLVGMKLNVHMNPPQVKAAIISEHLAKMSMRKENPSVGEACGEILNNSSVMEYSRESGVLTVVFRNMSLRKIKRADKRGAETVAEEKFAVLFTTSFNVAAGELVFHVRTLSLPVVVIVHGNQEPNALATIIWDNAFAEPGRQPFEVPDRVQWHTLSQALNSKFRSSTGRQLTQDNMNYLAGKLFNGQGHESFDDMPVSWNMFNKEHLPGRGFTFWKWFHGVMELTKKYIKGPWVDGFVLGFVGRAHAQELLLAKPSGTFLLRYSDSEVGGITIAWVEDNNGERQVWNLQPFTGEDFNMQALPDRIKDLGQLVNLYPDTHKENAFGKYYTPEPDPNKTKDDGYVRRVLKTVPLVPGHQQAPLNADNPGTPRPQHTMEQQPFSPQSPSVVPSMYSQHTNMDSLATVTGGHNDGGTGLAMYSDQDVRHLVEELNEDNFTDEYSVDQINVDDLLNRPVTIGQPM